MDSATVPIDLLLRGFDASILVSESVPNMDLCKLEQRMAASCVWGYIPNHFSGIPSLFDVELL